MQIEYKQIGPSTLTNTNRIQILANFPICLQIQIAFVKFSSAWRNFQIFALKLAFLLTCFGICARWEWLLSADTNINANTFEMDKYKQNTETLGPAPRQMQIEYEYISESMLRCYLFFRGSDNSPFAIKNFRLAPRPVMATPITSNCRQRRAIGSQGVYKVLPCSFAPFSLFAALALLPSLPPLSLLFFYFKKTFSWFLDVSHFSNFLCKSVAICHLFLF